MVEGSLARTPFRFSQRVPSRMARYRYFIHVHNLITSLLLCVRHPSNAGAYSSCTFVARLNEGRTGPMVTP